MRGNTPLRPRPAPIPSPLDFVVGIHKIHTLASELEALKADLINTHDKHETEHQARMGAVDAALKKTMAVHKGDPGRDGASVNLQQVITGVLRYVRMPVDGKTPEIDYQKAARIAATLIEKPKDGASPRMDDLVAAVFDALEKGKRKINIKHIGDFKDGLEQTLGPIRSLAAGARGGGDIVLAGAGVTITSVGGKKVISASGGGLTPITITGTVDDSNKTFNAAVQPTLLNINGSFYQQTGGAYTWTYVAGTITLSAAVGTGGSIFGV